MSSLVLTLLIVVQLNIKQWKRETVGNYFLQQLRNNFGKFSQRAKRKLHQEGENMGYEVALKKRSLSVYCRFEDPVIYFQHYNLHNAYKLVHFLLQIELKF